MARQAGGEAQGGEFSRITRCEASHSPSLSIIDRFSGPSLGRALGRGGQRSSLLVPFSHPHDPLLRQVAAWIAYPPTERVWVKWHFKTDQGIHCLTNEEAATKAPFGAQEDLVNAIDAGEFPSWTVKIQVMTEDEARSADFNPFDVTKVWPHARFPLIEVGKLTLNRNVGNYFAETEQSAFSPSNLVPGVGVSPDRMLQARLFAYPDAHRYRLGANYQDIPVNAPRCAVQNYQRDGQFAGTGRAADASVNFYPNDRSAEGAPGLHHGATEPPLPIEESAAATWYDNREDDNYTQAGDLFRIMSVDQKQQLFGNIAGGLAQATRSVQERLLAQFDQADPGYGAGVRGALQAAGRSD